MLLKITDGTKIILNGVSYYVIRTSMMKHNDNSSWKKDVYQEVKLVLSTKNNEEEITLELSPGHIAIDERNLSSLIVLLNGAE